MKTVFGKRLSTCPQILLIQKAFGLLDFLLFFVERFFYSKTARIGIDMALCLTLRIILAKFCSM